MSEEPRAVRAFLLEPDGEMNAGECAHHLQNDPRLRPALLSRAPQQLEVLSQRLLQGEHAPAVVDEGSEPASAVEVPMAGRETRSSEVDF